MNTYFLIATPVKGLLWCILLFILCLIGVHIARLAQIGWAYQAQKRKPAKPAPPPEQKAPTEKPQEPIYYIVERKTRKAKPAYGEPKPIQFRKEG